MDSPGVVSLWFGNCTNEDFLRKYVEIKYDEKDDRVQSTFMRDFEIDIIGYNQDLLELTYSDSATSSLSELLKNASYSEIMLQELVEFYGDKLTEKYNVAIRLYDFEYEVGIEEAVLDDKKLTFIGSLIYEE